MAPLADWSAQVILKITVSNKGRQFKTFDAPFQIKALGESDEPGTFVGLASVYNVTDLHGEVVMPGAFAKTIAERPVVKLLYQHDTWDPIGTGEISDSGAGLVIKAKLAMGVGRARDTYELLKAGVLDSLSIGFNVIKDSVEGKVRKISEIRLWEVSVVTFPACTQAMIGAVKEAASALPPDEAAIAAEFTAKAAELETALRTGRMSADAMLSLKSQVEALAALLTVAAPETGTPAPAEAADQHVEPEHIHSLRELFTNAAALAGSQRG